MQKKNHLTRGTSLTPLITGYSDWSCQDPDLIQTQLWEGGFLPSAGALAEEWMK